MPDKIKKIDKKLVRYSDGGDEETIAQIEVAEPKPRKFFKKITESMLYKINKKIEKNIKKDKDYKTQKKELVELVKRHPYRVFPEYTKFMKYVKDKKEEEYWFEEIDLIKLRQTGVINVLENNTAILYPGKKYVLDLDIIRGSKNPKKICKIPNAWKLFDKKDDNKFTLHQRLALSEQYVRNQNDWIKDEYNLVLANIGIIVSNQPRSSKDDHKRIFKTYPLAHKKFAVFGKKGHSEANLIDCLNDKKFLKHTLKKFFEKFKPDKKGRRHKIYGIVLDIYSTREVCDGCTEKLGQLQTSYGKNDFLRIIEKLFKKKEFDLPKKAADITKRGEDNPKQNPRLKLIIRATGDIKTKPSKGKITRFTPHDLTEKFKEHHRDICNHLPGVVLHVLPSGEQSKKIEKKYRDINKSSFWCRHTAFISSTYTERSYKWDEDSRLWVGKGTKRENF